MAGVDVLASVMSGANAAFLEDLYARWVENPNSVDAVLRRAVRGAERRGPRRADGRLRRVLGAAHPRQVRPGPGAAAGAEEGRQGAPRRRARPWTRPPRQRAVLDSIRALMLIRSYRVRGHLEAQLDPLGLQMPKPHAGARPRDLRLHRQPTWTGRSSSTSCWARNTATLREILTILPRRPTAARSASSSCTSRTPTRRPGSSAGSRARPGAPPSTRRPSATILEQLTEAEGFEAFCAEEIRQHQALRPGRRREHHPRASSDHRDRGRSSASTRSSSACRIAAGSTCWSTS